MYLTFHVQLSGRTYVSIHAYVYMHVHAIIITRIRTRMQACYIHPYTRLGVHTHAVHTCMSCPVLSCHVFISFHHTHTASIQLLTHLAPVRNEQTKDAFAYLFNGMDKDSSQHISLDEFLSFFHQKGGWEGDDKKVRRREAGRGNGARDDSKYGLANSNNNNNNANNKSSDSNNSSMSRSASRDGGSGIGHLDEGRPGSSRKRGKEDGRLVTLKEEIMALMLEDYRRQTTTNTTHLRKYGSSEFR